MPWFFFFLIFLFVFFSCWISSDTHLLYIIHGPICAALLVSIFQIVFCFLGLFFFLAALDELTKVRTLS